jgi:hypothetical protein
MTQCSSAEAASSEEELCLRFEQSLSHWAARSPNAIWRGRTLDADVVIQIGGTPFLLRIEQGNVVRCTRAVPIFRQRDFTIKGTLAGWSALWQSPPPPGWQDLLALTKRKEMTLEGNTQMVFAHLQFIKDLLTLPRGRSL